MSRRHLQKPSSSLSLDDLRHQWAEAWGVTPHAKIGRFMLESSLAYKQRELSGISLSYDQQARLKQLIKQYRRNPKCFEQNTVELKPGTKLVKMWNGKRYTVLVQPAGYEYDGMVYGSLSHIASLITGTRWNGWAFFDLKKSKAA